MATSPQLAFVTLVTSDSYLPGALVVAAALHDVHASPPIYPDEYDRSEFDRVCLVTPETLDVNTMKQLRRAFDVVVGVEVIEEDTEEGLKLLGRLDLRTVLTKLHVFRLTSYQKIIFLDADVLPLRPISHLFRISASLAAVPDVGWPDIFNSGFVVLEPSEAKFKELMAVVKNKGSWDGGDQGVLNEWAGQDWDRLSFTYNTTPTAVYTYAPAYKRFGSQISNIHFIGPNKPWLQIPLRSPNTSSSASPPTSLPSQEFEPPPSYGYPALLDRWFAVYDKHYRSTPTTAQNLPTPTTSPTTSRNVPPSDESPSTLTGVPTVQRYRSLWNSDVQPTDQADTSDIGAPLGLEELRRLAIEGVGKSETHGGEGTYRSLPLEGRIDLMRPQKVKSESEDIRPRAVRIVLSEGPQTPVRSSSPMTTLPTPGPHELPPTPMFRGHSLPPETPTHARPSIEGLSYIPITPDDNHFQPQSQTSSPAFSLVSRSISPRLPVTPPRHRSPPIVTWNPAVEAPPNAPPPASHFPEDTYFPNVWDAKSHDYPVPDDDGGLFPMPPVPSIPEMLIKQGHYQAVIGDHKYEEPQHQSHPGEHIHQPQHQDQQPSEAHPFHESHPAHQSSHPQPDRTKVAAVFPWEEKPRHAPVRFFPRTDSPPPGHPFIQPQSPALKLNLRPPPAHVPSVSLPHPQPFPRTTTYANAWDNVPSIQRYASRLVGTVPPHPTTGMPDTGPIKKGNGGAAGYRRWQDMVEASSRDADDEDEDDDEDGSPFSGEAESDRSRTPGDHEGHRSSPRKRYKGRGVQTVPKETRSQCVQVSNGDGKQVTSAPRNTNHQERIDVKQSSPDQNQPHSLVTSSQPHNPNVLNVTQPMASDVSSVPELSPAISTEVARAGREAISPPSSMGPSSPPEGVPVLPGVQLNLNPAPRPVGRTFDPARSVDVFKKGSEEVLARFLKIGSWEEDAATHTASPSAV